MNHAAVGYGQVRTTTIAPRAAERQLLRRAAAEIEAAGDDFPALAAALQRNTELWTTFAVDLAGPGNALPEALRAGLLSLAAFVARHAGEALAGRAGPGVLCEINRDVAAGLDAAAAAAA